MVLKNLVRRDSFSVRFQSALVCRVTENRNQHFPCCRHTILADRMAIELERQFHIAVTKQAATTAILEMSFMPKM